MEIVVLTTKRDSVTKLPAARDKNKMLESDVTITKSDTVTESSTVNDKNKMFRKLKGINTKKRTVAELPIDKHKKEDDEDSMSTGGSDKAVLNDGNEDTKDTKNDKATDKNVLQDDIEGTKNIEGTMSTSGFDNEE